MAKPLYEVVRPGRWADILGQPKILQRIELLRKSGLSGRAYWLTGASGTGKTTIARLLASEVAGDMGSIEIDSSELTPAYCRELEQSIQSRCLQAPYGRAVIINEAHGLRADTIRRLLVALESIPNHAIWVFTTTNDAMAEFDGIDAGPLLSRCVRLALTNQGLADTFANHLRSIGEQRGLMRHGYNAKGLVQRCGNNLRAALVALESGECL